MPNQNATGSTPVMWTGSRTGDVNDHLRFVVYESGGDSGKLEARLVFSYIKKRKKELGFFEQRTLDRRLRKIEDAFDAAVANGQNRLGEKLLRELARETRESILYARGVRQYVEKEDIWKHKNRIKGGHISDTRLEDYTRVIPKDVAASIDAVRDLFDGFVVLHYHNVAAEERSAKGQRMDPEEKARMRDPIVFGLVREAPDRWYFVDDWEDEHCDLTFDEVVTAVGRESLISKEPTLDA